MGRLSINAMTGKLSELYTQYNLRSYVDPDPLVFLYNYPDVRDREIAGLIASSLAYGRVVMIMGAVADVLNRMEKAPYAFVMNTDKQSLQKCFKGFRYRFASEEHLTALILGIQGILKKFGSVEACFLEGAGDASGDVDVFRGLGGIYREVNTAGSPGHLVADPLKSSACKRSLLYLRWMARKDEVDPGGWDLPCRHLVVPVDTHMHKIGSLLGFTRRKAADKTCALEITRGFSRIDPEDPVRFDFALTRFGIRQQFDISDLRRFLYGSDPGTHGGGCKR